MPFLSRQSSSAAARNTAVDSWQQDSYTPGHLPRILPEVVRSRSNQPCANPECSSRWTMLWKNHRRPVFEGQWACGSRCLQAIVQRSLRRERGGFLSSGTSAAHLHRHRVPVGLTLLSRGLITQEQLRSALALQAAGDTRRIGELLVEQCDVPSAYVTRGLAAQWSCPVLPMDNFLPSSMALVLPRILLEEFELLPLCVAASQLLYLAFHDRMDASAAFAIEQMSGLRVESGLVDDQQFAYARARLFESSFVESSLESFTDIPDLSASIASKLLRLQPIGSHIVRVHHYYWLRCWLESDSYSGAGTLPATGEDVVDTLFTLKAS